MGRRTLFQQEQEQKQRMRVSPQAEEFSPAERMRLRALLRQLEEVPVVDEYLDCPEVAAKLGLSTRTVRDLANEGAFDGVWGQAWKPQHNRLKVPSRGVQAFIAARSACGAQPIDQEEEA